jgi:hypothetical protein
MVSLTPDDIEISYSQPRPIDRMRFLPDHVDVIIRRNRSPQITSTVPILLFSHVISVLG